MDDSSGRRCADEASGRCKIEASEVASVMTRALTTSRVAELYSLVPAGVGKGELGNLLETHQVLCPAQLSLRII